MNLLMYFVSFGTFILLAGKLGKHIGELPAYAVGAVTGVCVYALYLYLRGQAERAAEKRRSSAWAENQREEEANRLKLMEAALPRHIESLRGQIAKLSLISLRAATEVTAAQANFNERAFAPFWESVEKTVAVLAEYDKELNYLQYKANELDEFAKKLKRVSPSRAELQVLPEVVAPASELKQLVRRAQRDFEFSQIYESRRTNAILIEGFSTLASAIDGLGERIENAVRNLKEPRLETRGDA